MATAEDFVSTAKKYVVTLETPSGSNKQPFAPRCGHANGQPWCASFVVAVADEVGVPLPNRSAWTPSMADGFKRAARFYQKPKRGDIGFIDFPGDNKTRVQHVVIVDEPGSYYVRTIEGNTSSGNKGSQDNGGGVYIRYRPYDIFVGFGRPAFNDEPPTKGIGILVDDQEMTMATVIQRPQGGYIVVQHDGGVFAYDNAPFRGSIPGDPKIKLGGNVIGGAWTTSGNGYWLLARDGAVYAYGDAEYYGGFNAEPKETRGGRYAIGMACTGPTSYRVVTFDPSGDKSPYDGYDYKKKGT
jgi:hypothetical protein